MSNALKDAKDVFVKGGAEALRAAAMNAEPVETVPIATDKPDILTPRRFNWQIVPEKPLPVFKLADMTISTVGNITNVQALPKAGKSSALAALIAAPIVGNRIGPDTLGFSAENPEGKALIHLDTEQSAYDHDQLIRRALKRAWATEPPPWLMSYCVTDLDIGQRKQALLDAIELANKEHGGVFAILIDGIADLCLSPNDDAEAFALVGNLHALTMANQCTIVTVLHENPGSETGKTRGHLGSQLERKAETNLRLAKDSNGITSMWIDRARHGHLPKEQATCFQWSDNAGMHVSCGTAGEVKSAETHKKQCSEASEILTGKCTKTYTQLVQMVQEAFGVKDRAAKDRVKAWYHNGIIRKNDDGHYFLA